jgi:hypothetical protein
MYLLLFSICHESMLSFIVLDGRVRALYNEISLGHCCSCFFKGSNIYASERKNFFIPQLSIGVLPFQIIADAAVQTFHHRWIQGVVRAGKGLFVQKRSVQDVTCFHSPNIPCGAR